MEVDLSNLDQKTREKVDDIFRRDFDLKVLQAIRRQTKVAALNYLHRPRARDGFGERVIEVDAMFDSMWRTVYGQSYTEDKDLLKFLVRRNPEIRVQSRGTKIQVGWAPTRETAKFSKRYLTPRREGAKAGNGKATAA